MEEGDEVTKIIKKRLIQFKRLGRDGSVLFDFRPFINIRFKADLFSEVAFCISVANSSAMAGLTFQKKLCEHKGEICYEKVSELLKSSGVRFPKTKAGYIVEAFGKRSEINDILKEGSSTEARDQLIRKVRGLGYKEASHLLRNTGREDIAILDRHILRWLVKNEYLDDIPKNLNRHRYKKVEELMREIAIMRDTNLAELDLLLWYEMTGKVLK